MNPYESPQTTAPPPLDPVVVQAHLEQVSFRQLAEITWSFVLPRQIAVAALLIAMVLATVTWQFYVPGNNPNWVTIVMLGCGSVLAVLGCWAWIVSQIARNLLQERINDPPTPGKLEVVFIGFGYWAATSSISACLFRGFTLGLWQTPLFVAGQVFFLLSLGLMAKIEIMGLLFLRSFVPDHSWRQNGSDLQRVSFIGAAITVAGATLCYLDSNPASFAWGWLLLALVGIIVYVLPFLMGYRQLAQEFDKLWP